MSQEVYNRGIVPPTYQEGWFKTELNKIVRAIPKTVASLTDYATGSWTPVLGGATSESGQTYSVQDGTYVRVGRLVTAVFNVAASNAGTVTGGAQIKGLPFAAATSKGRAGAVIGLSSGLGIAVVELTGWIEAAATAISLQHRTAAAVAGTASPNTLFQGATPQLIGTITYLTNV